MNKKGNYGDIFELIKTFFIGGTFLILVILILTSFNEQVQGMNESMVPADIKNGSAEFTERTPVIWDGFFMMILVAFFAFSMISARLIPSTPKFMGIAFFVLIAIPFATMMIVNVWDVFASQTLVSGVLENMPMFAYIMQNMVYVSLIYVFLVALSLLTKTEERL